MTDKLRKQIAESVLSYFSTYPPCDYDKLLRFVIDDLGLSILREELKDVVVRMIAAGKLRYYTGLTIGLSDLKETTGRLDFIIDSLEFDDGTGMVNDVALIVSQKEANEIIDLVSVGMSPWEIRQLKNNYTNLQYKGYRLLVV